jgi:hypothetical protein
MRLGVVLIVAVLIALAASSFAADCPEAVESEVLAALDRFLLDGFNSRDPEVWAETLSYPHCRIGGVESNVWETPEAYADDFDYPAQLAMGWDHSEWGSTEVLWCREDAAFARVHYLRKRADDSILHSLHGIYTLTLQHDGWGVLARFSALIPAEGEAKARAEESAKAALREHLTAVRADNRAAIAGSLSYHFLSLIDERATVLDAPEHVRRPFSSCGGVGEPEPLLVASGAVILGLGLDEAQGGPSAVYEITLQGGQWGVRGCASFGGESTSLESKQQATDDTPTLPRTLAMMDQAGNGDGKVQRAEIPPRYAARFDALDTDGDGVLTAAEVDAVLQRERAEVPVFEDVLGDLPPATLALLGGKLYDVGFLDGTLHDASRDRDIPFRIRYPKSVEGPVPIVLLSHGGYGSRYGYTTYGYLATSYARLGFLAVNIGHLESANEVKHRYDRPLDVSFVIDALDRVQAISMRIPTGEDEAMPMPADFAGVPDVDHLGHMGHSFGGFTAHAVGGTNWAPTMGIRNFRDPRVDAIVPMSPQGFHRFGGYDEGPDNNSWSEITIPSYLICGEREAPQWRRQPFDRYPAVGDKFFTVGKGMGHEIVNGDGTGRVKRLLAVNTALFFHTYLRAGDGRCAIGTLDWIDGWTLERKLDPTAGPNCE